MPMPSPKKDEDKDKYISRCMSNSTMVSEYDDEAQRAAICNTTWKDKSNNSKGITLTEEIFGVGTWNGINFEIEDLNLIAVAFHALGDNHQVSLKLGHNEEQPLTDGKPALGWVTDVFVQGTKLMAVFENVPEIVAEAIRKKLYKNKSIELDMGVEYKGDYYFWVLSGVALLGADIPAVNTLNDLGTLMSKSTNTLQFKKREVFTMTSNENRSTTMADPTIQEELNTLKAKFKALEVEHDKLITENRTLKSTNAELKAEFKVVEEKDKNRKVAEERSGLETELNGMVKEKTIAPHIRDDFMRDYDEAENKEVILFSVKKLKKTIETSPQYFGAEQARKKAEQDRTEDDKDPSEVVTSRTREYMAKNGEKNFRVAKNAVLRADPELAERYVKGGE